MTNPAPPSPAEIASRCKQIQKTWSPEVRRQRESGISHRRGGRPETVQPYQIPVDVKIIASKPARTI